MGDISRPSAVDGGNVGVDDQSNAAPDATPNSPRNSTGVDSQVTVSDHMSMTPLHESPQQSPRSSVAAHYSATPAPAKGEHSDSGGARNLVHKPFNMRQNKRGPRPGPSDVPPPHHVPNHYRSLSAPEPVFHPGFQVSGVPAPMYPYNVHHGHGSPVLAPPVMSNGFQPHMQPAVYFNNRPSYPPPPPPQPYAVGPPFPGSLGAVHNIPAGPHTFRATYPVEPSHQGVSKDLLPIAELKSRLVKQIEYYFSDENLRTCDLYFMNLVDEQGWIPIASIAEFRKIKEMNVEITFILDALKASEVIQVQGDKVRRRNQWSEWILAYARWKTPWSVSDAAKILKESNNGSASSSDAKKSDFSKDEIEVPSTKAGIVDHPLLDSDNMMDCARMKSDSYKDKIDVHSTEGSIVQHSPLTSDNMETLIDCAQMKGNDNGLGSQFDHIADSTKQHRKSYKQALSTEKSLRSCRNRKTNSFPLVDEKVKDELGKTVNEHPSTAGSSRSRIDDDEDSQVAEKLVILIQKCNELKPNQPKQNKDKPIDKRSDSASRTSDDYTEGISSFATGNADISTISESLPVFSFYLTPLGSQGLSPSESIASSKGTVDSLATSSQPCQRPDDKLLEGSCFIYQSYKELHENCLIERKKTGTSCNEDMHTLYGFWCYFLNQLFVRSMYGEFHKFALEDYASGHDYGIKCLFRFYSDGLEEKYTEELYKDFEQLTLDLCKKGNLYWLEQYRSFHHRRKVNGHSEPLKMSPELDRLIREKYHT